MHLKLNRSLTKQRTRSVENIVIAEVSRINLCHCERW